MANIIDSTYFKKHPTKFVQSETLGNGVSSEVAGADVSFIDENIEVYEPRFFHQVLGNDLATEFLEAYEESVKETDPIPLEQKWEDMLAQLVDSDKKRSPIANYVFFNAAYQLLEQMTRVGGVRGKKDEMEIAGVKASQVRAWNLMTFSLVPFYKYMIENIDIYQHDEVYYKPDENMLKFINQHGI